MADPTEIGQSIPVSGQDEDIIDPPRPMLLRDDGVRELVPRASSPVDGKKNKGGRPPGTAQSWIAKLMGSTERALVYKRDDKGNLSLCADYTQREVERSGNMDLFIKDYLVPTYGYGQYEVHAIKADNTEISLGTSHQLLPKGVAMDGTSGADPTAMFESVSRAQMAIVAEAEKKAAATAVAGNAQVESLVKLMGLMGIKNGQDMNPLTMMMMMQMIPKPDNGSGVGAASIAAMNEAFKAALEQVKASQMPMPPPLPMLPPSPETSLSETITALATVLKPAPAPSVLDQIAVIAPLFKKEDGFKFGDLIPMLPMLQEFLKNLSGANQVGELREEIRGLKDKQGSDLSKMVENYRLMKEIAQDLNPAPRASEGFFDLIRDLIQTLPETTTAIGDLVVKINSAKDSKSDDEDPDDVTLEYPDGFENEIQKIVNSKNDGELVGNTLKAFTILAKHKGWNKHLGQMLTQAKGGEKEAVLEFIKGFFNGMKDGGNIEAEIAEKGINAFEKNIDGVIGWAKSIGKKKE
jgi:hypothetical protein